MALINSINQEIHCKVVYFGSFYGGKATNLQYIYSQTLPEDRGDLLSYATETERTLFFFFRSSYQVRGCSVFFHLYTTPGVVLSKEQQTAILQGADGVVFVADSQHCKLHHNWQMMQLLVEWLLAHPTQASLPIIMQYNKRDLKSALPIPELDYYLNPLKWPTFEAVAWHGQGVMLTFETLCKRVVEQLEQAAATPDEPGDARWDDALTLLDERKPAPCKEPPQVRTVDSHEHIIDIINRITFWPLVLLLTFLIVGVVTGWLPDTISLLLEQFSR
jgi:hypothetical protein